jgi:hypothetical protein
METCGRKQGAAPAAAATIYRNFLSCSLACKYLALFVRQLFVRTLFSSPARGLIAHFFPLIALTHSHSFSSSEYRKNINGAHSPCNLIKVLDPIMSEKLTLLMQFSLTQHHTHTRESLDLGAGTRREKLFIFVHFHISTNTHTHPTSTSDVSVHTYC